MLLVVMPEDELDEASDSASECLARVLTGGKIKEKRPITNARVLQALAAAAYLTGRGVSTLNHWESVEIGRHDVQLGSLPALLVRFVRQALPGAHAQLNVCKLLLC